MGNGHRLALGALLLSIFACLPRASRAPVHGTDPGLAAAPRIRDPKPALAPSPGDAVAVAVSLSRARYARALRGPLVKVDFAAATGRSDRPALAIALVIDRSGSMGEDEKLAYTIEAAKWVVANLGERDLLSIVTFNHTADVVAAAAPVVDRAYLSHRLDEVEADGRTDISAALLEAIAQLDASATASQSRHILVLTDGQANVGVIDARGLAGIVEKAHARGIGVSTLGCGTAFDEQILTAMATAGGGRYTYIDSPEQIPQAFKDELHGLLSVVAQNARLRVEVTGGAIARVYGQLPVDPARAYELRIGNVRESERGMLLVELAPDRFEPGATLTVDVSIVYDDPVTAEREHRDMSGTLAFADGADPGAAAGDPSVEMYAGVLDALERLEEAVYGADRARYGEAVAAFDRWYGRAYEYAMSSRDQQLLNHAFMLAHFMHELVELHDEGALHDHDDAREHLRKKGQYQRYLLIHHRD